VSDGLDGEPILAALEAMKATAYEAGMVEGRKRAAVSVLWEGCNHKELAVREFATWLCDKIYDDT
jgi:hypothetical protein